MGVGENREAASCHELGAKSLKDIPLKRGLIWPIEDLCKGLPLVAERNSTSGGLGVSDASADFAIPIVGRCNQSAAKGH